MDAQLLRIIEAARFLKVSKWTIYRWTEEGRLEATKIGHGSLRVFRASVNLLIENNRTDAREASEASRKTPVRLQATIAGRKR
jgi:excisionase family DNA binding protein